jgi:hypothetical protein
VVGERNLLSRPLLDIQRPAEHAGRRGFRLQLHHLAGIGVQREHQPPAAFGQFQSRRPVTHHARHAAA